MVKFEHHDAYANNQVKVTFAKEEFRVKLNMNTIPVDDLEWLKEHIVYEGNIPRISVRSQFTMVGKLKDPNFDLKVYTSNGSKKTIVGDYVCSRKKLTIYDKPIQQQ